MVEQAESDQDLLSIFAAEQELQGKFVRSPSICHYIDKNFQNFLMLGPLQAKVEGEIGLSVLCSQDLMITPVNILNFGEL